MEAVGATPAGSTSISFCEFLKLLGNAGVAHVIFRPNGLLEVTSQPVQEAPITTRVLGGVTMEWLLDKLLAAGVMFTDGRSEPRRFTKVLTAIAKFTLPLFYLALTYAMMRQLIDDQSKGSGGPAEEKKKRRGTPRGGGALVTWDSVVGIDGARLELMEVIDFMRRPGRYRRMGATCPRGVLVSGPPGCGKTLLARAAAQEAGMSFIACSASDFVEVFVGRGAARVRELFRCALAKAPCILFFDELDALAKARADGLHGNDEREQTLNQLLTEMDGFDTLQEEACPVLVIAATNRPDVLDPALLRPGRFDRHVRVPPLDARGRLAVLDVHARNRGVPLESFEDLERIARESAGLSGAELANVINEAALLAVREGADTDKVRGAHLGAALHKVRDAQAQGFADAQPDEGLLPHMAQLVQMAAAAGAAAART